MNKINGTFRKMRKFSSTWKGRVCIAVFGIAVAFAGIQASSAGDLFEVAKNIDLFTSVYKDLNTYYVDDIDPNKLMRTGIDAMLESLDPYTNYISSADMEGYTFQITGNYGGVGATIRPINGNVTITECFKGFPAEKAGLQPGDIIETIDEKNVTGLNEDAISDLMRGSPGTTVNLKVLRPFENREFEVAVNREVIDIHNVPYYGMINDSIGYIILTKFTQDAGANVGSALSELEKENPGLSGVILDLRSDPGGLLREAVNVSNVFIDKGREVCSTKGRVQDWNRTFNTLNPPVDTKIPLVVLTNSMSASASEIVSGVIQDYDRGLIIGTKSYGKGLVQTTRDLDYNAKLKLTTAKYYIPSGRCIQALDYSHRNPDGSVGKIPDSLKSAFKTSTGRTVYDGGGIDPDVSVAAETYKNITIALLRKDLIFQYATKYKYEHPTIADARNFSLTDAEYDDFVQWLSDKQYDYTTETEDKLQDFVATARDENYYDAIADDVTDLQSKIGHDKHADLYKYKEEILQELNSEIASRYYGSDGRVESSFAGDPDIQHALYYFRHTNAYDSLLVPHP